MPIAVLSTIIATESTLGYGLTKWLAGIGFSLGLILVVVAGAELFTGNNLVVMSWVDRNITLTRLLRNWVVVYAGNFAGALSVVVMVYLAGWWTQGDNSVGGTALSIAAGKASLPFGEAFVRGILANALVCLAVWLTFSARTTTDRIAVGGRTVIDKVFAIIFPISAFVAAGFEHSVANMYFVPMGLLLRDHAEVAKAAGLNGSDLAQLDLGGFANNLAAATLGNIVGGAVLVGLVYWFVYLRPSKE